jgi:hypothetical protein
MTTFDDRERSFEKKFALDEELKFRARARRDRLLAEWAAAKLGLSGAAEADYVKAIRHADLIQKGELDGVLNKIAQDFAAKGVAVSEKEIRQASREFLAKAVAQIEAEPKT